MDNVLILGASGAIANAIANLFVTAHPNANLHLVSRSNLSPFANNVHTHCMQDYDENSLHLMAERLSSNAPFDLVFVATGILHKDELMPEKSMRDMSAEKLQQLYYVNATVPALIAKHFVPFLNKSSKAVFAALSARVGSISDNRLGGWYSYRASKAALNMLIKNIAIETTRKNKQAIIVGLHPGTVDSRLSKPFQKNVPDGKLFTPEFSAEKLLKVIQELSPSDTGKCFAWDGQEVKP